jgi:hypothetical protein
MGNIRRVKYSELFADALEKVIAGEELLLGRGEAMRKGKIRGSFTVEAALLLPMIIFIICSLVYLGFYLHDRSRLEGLVDEVLMKGALSAKHEADIRTGKVDYANIRKRGVLYLLIGDTKQQEDQIEKYLWELSGQGFFLTEIRDIKVELGKYKLKITLEGEFKVPMRGIREFFDPNPQIIIEAERSIHNPAEFIRVSEVVLDTASKIKGFDELKKRIEDILNTSK